MVVKVLVCDTVDVENLGLTEGFEVDYRAGVSRAKLLQVIGDYEVLVVRSRTKVDKEVLQSAKRLKVVARSGTGLDNVDVAYARELKITVMNSPEALVEAVAEHVVLLMLALSRNLVSADASTKAGRWEKESLVGRELKGKILGVVGFGRIGQRVGEVALALGMNIIVNDALVMPPEVIAKFRCRQVALETIFSDADYVTLHVPLDQGTRHIVDAWRISQMKKTGFLINTSRGSVIDQDALVAALKEKRLAGAALDVFEKEPPSGEILSAPNVILTPHIAGQTSEAQVAATRVIGEKIRAHFKQP